jgi:2-polyprenyl-3-methyl-5-hydroxy-6-metoxy-1,4-benzoquinol methylase
LPHGQQGQQLIERWDRAYRGQQRPGWDTGLIADDLKRAVSEGHIKPCRIVELGCGSGTNAIFLASQGFDVTAIDVAPTALGIADAKARKAGVGVRWLLADVLNLPDLGTFDLIFDRGCYHNVRYVNAAGFVEAVRQLSRPGSQALIVSSEPCGAARSSSSRRCATISPRRSTSSGSRNPKSKPAPTVPNAVPPGR